MSISEYILALMSIVVGLAMTQLLSGAAEIAQHAKPVRTYWIHTAWMVNLFVTLIHFWWWEFALMQIETWTFLPYAFVICFAVLLYFLVALLVPQHLSEQADLKEYFYSHRGWFFGTMALIQVVDFGDTFVKGWAYFIGLGPYYPIRNLVIIGLCATAIRTRNERFHGFMVVLLIRSGQQFLCVICAARAAPDSDRTPAESRRTCMPFRTARAATCRVPLPGR